MGRKQQEQNEAPSTFMGLTTGKFLIAMGSLIVGTFLLAYLIVVPGGEMRAASEADHKEFQQLVSQNYEVNSVGFTPNRKPTGYGVVVGTGTTIHTCTGISKDDVIAKKPITCNDGFVLQAKK